MRIAILSDIHGNVPALEAVLADAREQGAEQLICLGDLAFMGPQPGECVARIRDLGIPCIHGNTDLFLLEAAGITPNRPLSLPKGALDGMMPTLRWQVERMARADLEFLAALPFSHRMKVDGQTLLFVHASPHDVMAGIRPTMSPDEIRPLLRGEEADWIIVGHVHEPYVFRFEGRWLANPGAVGAPRDGDSRASYAILDTARSSFAVRRVAYDWEAAVAAARERGFFMDPDRYGTYLAQGTWPDK